MGNPKCINCAERRRCKDNFTSWIFFTIGLVATVAVRIVILLTHLDPVYSKTAWYIGVVGFFIFFAYKYKINQARAKIIEQRDLIAKLQLNRQLAKDESEVLSQILCAISSSKERFNYFFIFFLSGAALALALYWDFVK